MADIEIEMKEKKKKNRKILVKVMSTQEFGAFLK